MKIIQYKGRFAIRKWCWYDWNFIYADAKDLLYSLDVPRWWRKPYIKWALFDTLEDLERAIENRKKRSDDEDIVIKTIKL